MRKNVTNRIQADVIAADLEQFRRGQTVEEWVGNSYGSELYPSTYCLVHWSTVIAEFKMNEHGYLVMTYFDARYHSATTRGFQGRILDAVSRVIPDSFALDAARRELGKSTSKRGIVRPNIAV